MELPLNRNESVSSLAFPSDSKDTLHFPVINKVSLFNSYDKAFEDIKSCLDKAGQPVVVSFINAHGYNLCFSNAPFAKALIRSDFLLRDGKGMEILFKVLGKDPGVNLIGTDFIPFILERQKGKTIALLGTEEPYLTKATEVVKAKGLDVVTAQHGFFSPENYLSLVKSSKPAIILLGMGMPKQEVVSELLKNELDYSCLIINGGAIIDYFGNKVSRAPTWMRKNGLEWLYRFALEPKRMFNRYMVGNIVFLKRVNKLKSRSKVTS